MKAEVLSLSFLLPPSSFLLTLLFTGCFGREEPLPPREALARAAQRIDVILREEAASPDRPPRPTPPESPPNPREVTFWFYQHPLCTALLTDPKLADTFHGTHPGVKLSHQFIGDWYVAVQKLTVSVAAGDVPDIALVKRSWLERLAHAGRIAPLDTLLPASMLDSLRKPSIEAFTVDGRLYALPADGFCSVLYYNQDLVGDTAPRTWEELRAAAKSAVSRQTGARDHRRDGDVTATGRVYGLGDVPFLEALWSGGGDLVKGSRGGLLDPEAIEALAFILSLRADGLTHPYALGSPERAFGLFLAGQAAMTVASSEYLPRLQGCGFRAAIAPVPGKSGPISRLSDSALVVFARYAQAKRAAIVDVLDLLTGPRLQGQEAAARGSAPVRVTDQQFPVPRGLEDAYGAARATPLRPRWSEMEFETMHYLGLAYLWSGTL